MYHVGQPAKRRHRLRRVLVAFGVLAIIGAAVAVPKLLRPETVIRGAAPSETQVAIAEPPIQTITKPGFQLALPKDWKEIPNTTGLATYSWHGTLKADDARQLDVYADSVPSTLAVNRMLPVRAEGSGVQPTDAVSDNCTKFTDKNTANAAAGTASAKWAGISFLCDTGNTLREVVGTSSMEGINTVSVIGASGATHRFFFLYNDQSGQFDIQTFTSILESFKAL